MGLISDYNIEEKVYENSQNIIYKASRKEDNLSVLIKIFKNDSQKENVFERIKKEYEITKYAGSIDGVIKVYDLINYKTTLAIVMEDIKGKTLSEVIKDEEINFILFLKIAINLSEILNNLHKKNIIHKDIKPSNIILNLSTNQIRLIDFSISSLVSKETLDVINPEKFEGTLTYISPEQTGRMNRLIDYRSDFYSLGITFYKMFTKKTPFEAKEPMEVIYGHLAKIPPPPHIVNPDIPLPLSKIILKLIAKTPEERYQSATGLKNDLEECLRQFVVNGKIEDFQIAKNDMSDKFLISERIYGRDKEIKELMKSFTDISLGGKRIIFISGESGCGKTSLIEEIFKPIISKLGFFISGKFDKYTKIPYFGIIQSIKELIKQVLMENEHKLSEIRKNILNSVGNSGKVLTNIIPELELIIGHQPDVEELTPSENQNRFNLVFDNFLAVFPTKDSPLVLFIDDLQWACDSSLKLIESLILDINLDNFLFVASYKEDKEEVNECFIKFISNPKIENNEHIKKIKVSNLDTESILDLLKDSFHIPKENLSNFSEIIKLKTDGNPFFIKEFLKSLYQNEIIYFKEGWNIDFEKGKDTKFTDNVIDIILNNIKKIQPDYLIVLKLASCIGNNFKIELLSILLQKNIGEIEHILNEIINERIIIKLENNFAFLNNKIRETIYSLLDTNEAKQNHYKIAKLLLEEFEKTNNEEELFDLVNQFNASKDVITDEDRNILIKLNVKTGKMAKSQGAFDGALNFFSKAISLLPDDCWEANHDFVIDLFTERAEANYLTINYLEAEKDFELVLSKANTLVEKSRIFQLKIDYYHSIGKFDKIKEILYKSLELFNMKFPKKVTKFLIIKELIKTKINLYKINIEKIENLNKLSDPVDIAMLEILSRSVSAMYIVDSKFSFLLILKIINHSIKKGISPLTALAFAFYGSVLCGLSDIENGYKYATFALKLIDKFGLNNIKAKILVLRTMFINFWKEHTKFIYPYLNEGYKLSCESGDLEFISNSLSVNTFFNFFNSKTLQESIFEFKNTHKQLRKINQEISILSYIWIQLISNLSEDTTDKLKLSGKFFDEDSVIPIIEKNKIMVISAQYYVAKIFLYFVFNDFESVLKLSEEKELDISEGLMGIIMVPLFYFIYGIALTQVYHKKSEDIQRKYFKKIKQILDKFKKWSKFCQDNFLHLYLLLQAEFARINKKDSQAMKLYDEAIKNCKATEFLNFEAICNEITAKYYFSKSLTKIAYTYLQEAYYCYLKWGALTKIKNIEERYPQFFSLLTRNVAGKESTDISVSISRKETSDTETFDIDAIIKASQTIASEIFIDELLTRIMTITMQVAGAQKGFFLLEKDGEWFIEGKITTEQQEELTKKLTIAESYIKDKIFIDEHNLIKVDIENQVTNEKNSTSIKTMIIDGKIIFNNFEIVDNIAGIIGGTVTIFQIIEEGLLRISTTVKKEGGGRAICTYIPKDSAVYKTIISGESFIGRAYVVNYSHITAYKPMFDQFGNLIAVIYVGDLLEPIPLKDADENLFPISIINYVIRTKENLLINDVFKDEKFQKSNYVIYNNPRSVLCVPLILQGKTIGILYLENKISNNAFTKNRLDILRLISTQAAISINNARLFENQVKLTKAYSKFVPHELIDLLSKKSILEVNYGDNAVKEMTILFSDIRDFTTLSEKMYPDDNFKFINSYLKRMEPIINKNNGFIDKYIGDAIMALFTNQPDDALNASIAMLKELKVYNQYRAKKGFSPIEIGIGLNTGSVMIGTIGGKNRMDGTVIGDSVNLASRIEGLTKKYKTPLLISLYTFSQLKNQPAYHMRMIDIVTVKGKSERIPIFEVFNADNEEILQKKLKTQDLFKEAVSQFLFDKKEDAEILFKKCLEDFPEDTVTQIYLEILAQRRGNKK